MLVAVHPWDIHGAHQVKMATAWVNRSDGDYPAYFEQPDFRATSLTDLASQLSPLTPGRP